MQLVGIANENEFYSDHYLSGIFSGDIRDVLAAWQEREASERESAKAKGQGGSKYEGYRSPPNALNALAHGLLQRIDEAGRTRAALRFLTSFGSKLPVLSRGVSNSNWPS